MELLIPILLILCGLALITVEIYVIPGMNIVGILGFLVIVFGIGYAFDQSGLWGGLSALAGTMVIGAGLWQLLKRTQAWDTFVLRTSLTGKSDSPLLEGRSERVSYLGKQGTALTPLRPTGVVEIDQERVEVRTEGEFIAAGSQIKVVAMDRQRIFVRLAHDSAAQKSVSSGND